MSKSSPAFKSAFAAYCQAVNDGADRSVLDPLWQAVMRALHDTPEPPVGLYGAAKVAKTLAALGCTFEVYAAGQSIDDDFDRMMREG